MQIATTPAKRQTARLAAILASTAMLALTSPAAAQSVADLPYDTMIDLGALPDGGLFPLVGSSDDGAVIVPRAKGSPLRWTAKGYEPLGSLGGSNKFMTESTAVSGDGRVIVGTSRDSANRLRAFRWTEAGGMQGLGSMGRESFANAVSGDGSVIAGNYTGDDGRPHAFRWTESGGMQDIDTLGSRSSAAYGISYDGAVVVGYRYTSLDGHAFRWTAARGMQSLDIPGQVSAPLISRDGSTVIVSSIVLNLGGRVFRWTETGGAEDIGTLGGKSTQAFATSDDGKVIVGHSSLSSSSDAIAFRWVEGIGMQSLGTGGRSESIALAVSGDGKVVAGVTDVSTGGSRSGPVRAFRWTEKDGMKDLGTLGGDYAKVDGMSRDGSTIFGWSKLADGTPRPFIYRARLIDFTNMIASFALTASDVEALGEGQRQNLGWVLDSRCQVAIGGKGCIGGAVQVMRVAADDKAVLMRRHDQGVKANVGVRLSGALTMGAGFGLFQQEDRAFSLKPDTAFHYGAWLDFAPGGTGPLGFKARLAAGGAVQGNAIERGRGLDNVELTPGRADLATLSARGQVEYGIALGKLALIPNAGITWQRSTLGAFTEAEGDFPAQFDRTRWQTSFASLGADLSVPLGAGTRAVLGGKADFDLDSDAVTMTGTSTIPGMETVKATSLYTRKDRRGRFELGLEHLSGKLGFSTHAGVHTPVIGSKPTLVFGLGFGAGF